LRIVASAGKHGVAEDDILHAVAHPLRTYTDQGDFSLVIVIGPARNVIVVEVGAVMRRTILGWSMRSLPGASTGPEPRER